MAGWNEQGGPGEREPVPVCAYLVRRGEQPDFARRSNIFAYSAALAARSDRFSALVDADGQMITTLPPTDKPDQSRGGVVDVHTIDRTKPPDFDDNLNPAPQLDTRELRILGSFAQLTDEDLKLDLTPRLDAVRRVTGLTDVTATELKELWERHKNPEGDA